MRLADRYEVAVVEIVLFGREDCDRRAWLLAGICWLLRRDKRSNHQNENDQAISHVSLRSHSQLFDYCNTNRIL